MMMFDRKKSLQTIMQKRMAGGGEVVAGPTPMNEERSREEDGSPDLLHLASQNVMDAFHSKSAEKLKSSLSNFLDLHMSQKDSSAEPEPED